MNRSARRPPLKRFLLLAAALAMGGCTFLQGSRLLAPETAGFSKVSTNLYVEAGSDETIRNALAVAMTTAEHAIGAAYGNVTSRPVVHACVTEACYAHLSAPGPRARIYYGHLILLSPRGLNWHYIAHEWSHAEMFARLKITAWWWKLPQWFDEGVAVAVSESPEHSESHWEFLEQSGIPRPTRAELHTLRTMTQWDDAVGRYGEKQNLQRRSTGETEIRPVYTAAGREVRSWLTTAGHTGLLTLIEQLNGAEDFAEAYHQAGGTP